jgi:CelD/BcsL family acetyltransferase involved in cellulose biosynthesis
VALSPEIAFLNPADPRWDAFLRQHPEATFSHSAAWLQILEATYGFRPFHLASFDAGLVDGVLPLLLIPSRLTGRRLASLPFSGPAGPLGRTPAATERLVEAAIGLVEQGAGRYLKLQGTATLRGALSGLAWTQPAVHSVLPLQGDLDQVWRGLPHRMVRQEIGRARRLGVVARVGTERSDLDTFYRLYLQTARKHGIPPQPRAFFQRIWRTMTPGEQVVVFLAELDGRALAAVLCLAFKDSLSMLYVGTDYRALRYHPVRLTDWAAIEWCCQRGLHRLDFLLTPLRNQGLRWYKRSFGALEMPLAVTYYPAGGSADRLREMLVAGRSPWSRAAHELVRRAPGPLLELLGRVAFRHVA